MITRLLAISVFGFLSCVVFADTDFDDGSKMVYDSDLIVADNRRKERREDRGDDRDDKQDCRQEEGVVGKDKRECKQDNRGEGDEVEGDKEAEADA